MNRRRRGQVVGEVDDQPVADAHANQGTREAAVVGPGLDSPPGRDFDACDLRGQIDLEDVADLDSGPGRPAVRDL